MRMAITLRELRTLKVGEDRLAMQSALFLDMVVRVNFNS
jgi:hypothetical protein